MNPFMKICSMKKSLVSLISIFIISALFTSFTYSEIDKTTLEKPDWYVGFQAYTFRLFSFEEALEKAASIGLKYVETYYGQNLTKDSDVKIHFTMDEKSRQKMKDLLQKYDIKLISSGVVTCKNDEEWEDLFKFAKEMEIQTITSEPKAEDLDLVETLADKFGINVAIHNHPSPSRYWNPDTVFEALKGRSLRLGVCADTGHWIRSGLNPVECLNKLEGRILELHFKDLNEKSREAHDVPWGTGVADVPAIFQELKRQNFSGYFMIEYEHNWENSVPDLKQCIENFEKMVAEL